MESEGLKASALRPRHFAALGNIEEAFAALQAVIDRVRIDLATRGWKPIDKPTALQETYWPRSCSRVVNRSACSKHLVGSW